ncbi:phosphotransferase [Nitrospirillum iridis]|uniref:Aminoglycoside phosphotransferase domain-containing protein n=1 Tax=Nitrospirillum iridis TaxID=765888 RepID=A0A7X0AY96_9PROT|nr:phosphotransferase [Nitrospirillum iridis]MBB6252263.1 hypothetical protein [Nitrospirillum iridis]
MPSLDVDALTNLASRLAGGPVQSLTPCRGGGNNRVYRVDTADGPLALKLYPTLAEDTRDRLRHEYTALTFLAERVRPGLLPRAMVADPTAGAALYEWVDGMPVTDHGLADVARVTALLADLLQAGLAGGDIGPAVEPCLATADILHRLAARVSALEPIAAREPALAGLLEQVRTLVGPLAEALGPSALEPLPAAALVLSPSDFGFHNALRRDDGSLTFLDFEYFGWDDPAKAASDFLWHAGQVLRADQRYRFAADMLALYGGGQVDFAERLMQVYPLHGLNWVLIVLNEFRPDRWRRRQLAGHADDWDAAKARQLAKAEKLLDRVRLACHLHNALRRDLSLEDWIAQTGALVGNEP